MCCDDMETTEPERRKSNRQTGTGDEPNADSAKDHRKTEVNYRAK